MSKRPAPGTTKTRLTPPLTPEQAADLYECLLLDTLANLGDRDDCTSLIAVDAPEAIEYFTSIAPQLDQVPQTHESSADPLGDRLDTVLTGCLDLGYTQTLALSSDSPDLPPSHLDDAFTALDRDDVDVVIGPTEDGGYYLIGWKRPWPPMVRQVTMSTSQVLDDTLAIATELGARVHLAPTWYDIDTAADLHRLGAHVSASGAPRSLAYLAKLDDQK